MRRDCGADDIAGVVLIRHPQGHSEIGVRPDVLADDPGRALRREDEMQSEGSAALGDVDQVVDEVRHLGDQKRQFVHDDDQARRTVGIAGLLQLDEILDTFVIEQEFAIADLRSKAAHRPSNQIGGQVGDETDAVRQRRALGEGTPTLVIDQEEGHPVGAVGIGHAEDPGLEELTLPRTRRPADEGVRALGAQVERERLRPGVPDRCAQIGGAIAAAGTRLPTRDRAVLLPPGQGVGRIIDGVCAEQRDDGDGAGQVGLVVLRRSAIHDRGEGTGDIDGGLHRDRIAGDRGQFRLAPDQTDLGGRGVVDAKEGAAGAGQIGDRLRSPEHEHPGFGSALREAQQS